MLNYNDLYNGFISIMDNTNKYSENLFDISQQWTNVFKNFYINQTLPILGINNPNLFFSLNKFQSGFLFAIKKNNIKQQFEVLVKDLHIGICNGVTMTGIYTTTPPLVPLRLQSCFNNQFSTKKIANLLAMKIITWVKYTFSIQNSSGAIIKWQ